MPARYPSFAVTPTLRQPFYASLLAVPITTAAACSGVQTPATTMRMRACGFRVERPVTAPEPQEKHSGLVSASVCRVLGRCARIAARSICATFLASESTLPRVITTRVRLRRCLSPPRMRDRSEIRSAATRLKPNPGLTSPLYQAVRAMPARGGSWRIVWISDKHRRRSLGRRGFLEVPCRFATAHLGHALRHCAASVCVQSSGLHSCHTVFQCMMRVALPQSARSQALPRC
jgi:hypothetical protein